MNAPVHEFNDENFEAEVINSDVPVVVDFWAEWCAPCRAVSPSIEKLATEFGDNVKFGKLDIDANPQAPQKYAIGSIPAILIFQHGVVVESLVGVRPYERYQQAVNELIAA